MNRLRDPQTLVFALLAATLLVPLWAVPHFPSQDGPTHLENAAILRDFGRGDRPLLQEFYTLNTHFDPNWVGHLALRGLLEFLPVFAAEKVLLSGYLLLLPWAAFYALEGVRRGSGPLAVLVLPFVPHFLYHMGFHNFCYGLGVWFLALGFWVRHQGQFGARSTLTLTLLVVLLYFCHLVAAAAALMAIGVLEAAFAFLDFQETRVFPWKRGLPLLAFVPVVPLAFAFVGRQGTGPAWTMSLGALWRDLRRPDVLWSYLPLEKLLADVVFWGLALLTAVVFLPRLVRRRLDRGDVYLVAVAVALVAYFAAPTSLSGGSFVNTRLSLFPFFLLIFWIGSRPFAAAARWAIQGVAGAVSLGFLVLHFSAYREFESYLREYLSVEGELRPTATLLPLTFTRGLRDGPLSEAKVGALRHASGYLAARVGVVELENYEATTGYFPVLFQDDVNPFVHLSPEGRGTDTGLQREPPRVDIARYERKTGKTVDYVLLWHVRPEQHGDDDARRLFRQLDEGYDLTFVSSGGLLQLYRRK